MGDYNPKTSYQFRWSDSKKIQKFIQGQFILHDIDPYEDSELQFDKVPEAKKLIDTIKYCYNNQIPLIIYDYANDKVWVSAVFDGDNTLNCTCNFNNQFETMVLTWNDKSISISMVSEEMLSADNVKTLFGTQSIVGSGNIDLFRHQLILTNTNDVSVSYIIESSNNLPIDSPQDFVTVTKADTDYTGHGLYLDANSNIQPAFIRYSAGNVIIQLQNGSIAPLKSVKDKVTTI